MAKNDGSGQQVLMKSRRIDGSTTLDMREQAIKEFNSPDSGEWVCNWPKGWTLPAQQPCTPGGAAAEGAL